MTSSEHIITTVSVKAEKHTYTSTKFETITIYIYLKAHFKWGYIYGLARLVHIQCTYRSWKLVIGDEFDGWDSDIEQF